MFIFPSNQCFIEHTCAYAWWAHMHRFLSVCPSVRLQLRIQLFRCGGAETEKWGAFNAVRGLMCISPI